MSNLVIGGAAVTGAGSFTVRFCFKPRAPAVGFTDMTPPPPMCGPITPDWTAAAVVNLGSALRPKWALEVSWATGGPRILEWSSER